MNLKQLLTATLIAAAFAVIHVAAERTSAQTVDGLCANPSSPAIQLDVAGDSTGVWHRTSHLGVIAPLGVLPSQQIGITLTVPSDRISYPVSVAPVDGGEIIAPANLRVTADGNNGKVSFSFRGGNARGRYRVLVIIGTDQYQIPIYVDPSNWNCPPPP